MRLFFAISALVAIMPNWLGCQHGATGDPAAAGRVAIVDLDAVASRLGRDVQLAQLLRQEEDALNQQLANARASYEQEIKQHEQRLSEEERAEQVAALRQQAAARLAQLQQQAQATLAQRKAELVEQFRDHVRPIAQQVAAERGFSIVLTKNDRVVFCLSEAVDISEAVAQRMLATQPPSETAVPVQPPAERSFDEAQPIRKQPSPVSESP